MVIGLANDGLNTKLSLRLGLPGACYMLKYFEHLKKYSIYMILFSFFKWFYLILERGEGKEKERERNISVWLPLACPHTHTGDLACNPGMCPDWELNWQPFDSQVFAPSTEPCPPGLILFSKLYLQQNSFKCGQSIVWDILWGRLVGAYVKI